MAKINSRAQRAALRRLSERANAERNSSIPHPALASSGSSSTSSSTSSSSSSGSSAPPPAAEIVSGAPAAELLARLGHELCDHLRGCGVPLEQGLTEAELQRIEAAQGFSFPPDLRSLLAACLPAAPGFPRWRRRSGKELVFKPDSGSLFPALKPRGAALHAARPAMIPVFSSFFLPASPCRTGNPLFLLREDTGAIVCLGGGLGEFFRRGFVGELGEFPMEDENQRRWSMSAVVDRCPEQQQLQEIQNQKQEIQEQERGKLESWGRSLDALARVSVEKLLREIESNPRSASRRRSFNGLQEPEEEEGDEGCSARLNELVVRNLIASRRNPSSAHHRPPTSPRRIEFWSAVAERQLKEHHRSGRRKLDPIILGLSMCLAPPPAPSSSRRTSSSGISSSSPSLLLEIPPDEYDPTPRIPIPDPKNSKLQQQPEWVSSLLDEVASRLRSAGWREDDITEMVDATSPKSVLQVKNLSYGGGSLEKSKPQEMNSREWVNLMSLSSSLKRAGFSVEEVSDALGFDLVNPRFLPDFICTN